MTESAALFISPKEAAARWSVGIDAIRRLIKSGQLPAYRLNGRIVRVRAADVDACFHLIPNKKADQ